MNNAPTVSFNDERKLNKQARFLKKLSETEHYLLCLNNDSLQLTIPA
jgi:hypothetical protein